MITEYMTLNTSRDADLWASDILMGIDCDSSAEGILSDWIWNNKPNINCTLSEHPISNLTTSELIEIIEDLA